MRGLRCFASRIGAALAFVAASLCAPEALAGEPPQKPILQVETGFHASSIRASALARSERFIVTGSADKSARLWELPSLRLRRTFRVPVGLGPEGRIHDVAISSDDRWVAVAGWTGWEWDQAGSIYFFEIASGNMVGRISGLPQVVRNLAYSPDGRYLAVGLLGGGLIIYGTNDYPEIYTDPHYAERIVSLDFASDGRLAVSSADGGVRIYSKGFDKKDTLSVPAESEPLEVRFSPDGKRIAVGYLNLPRVDVFDSATLEHLFSPDVPAAAGVRALYAVAWSADGQTLFAAGEQTTGADNKLVAWGRAGAGRSRLIETSRARMGRLLPLSDGSLFWGAEDPAMALLAPDGEEIARRDPETLDFAGLADRLLVSPDGEFVSLVQHAASGSQEFSLTSQRRGEYLPEFTALAPSSGLGAKIEIAPDRRSASIAGRPVELEPFEIIRHHAWSHDGSRVALATEWVVRVYRADGVPLWSVPLSVVAHAVNVTRDGRWVVAALSDGTLRWFSMHDGAPGPAVFLHSNNADWVAWLPSGHYAASPKGDRFVGWLQNRGAEQAPSFYRAVQFEREFYAPERLRAWFEGERVSESMTSVKLAALAPPEIAMNISTTLSPKLEGPTARIIVRARRRGPPMSRIGVYVNKIPIVPHRSRAVGADEGDWFERDFRIPLEPGENEIRVEVDAGVSRGVETIVVFNTGASQQAEVGDLYVVSIGVNELTNLDFDLRYASPDAKRIAQVLRMQKGGAFREVHERLIADGELTPSREVIEEALEFLKEARPIDTVVLFLAGHGVRDRAGNYYFVPRDASAADIERINAGATQAPSLVPWSRFVEALQNAVGRRVLIVDTCYAQQITGRLELDWLAKYSASSMFALLASSAAGELSAENPEFGAGLYTEGVVRALSGAADDDHSGTVVLSEVHTYAHEFVTNFRRKGQKPQFAAPRELGSTVLSAMSDASIAAVAADPTGNYPEKLRGIQLAPAEPPEPTPVVPVESTLDLERRLARLQEGEAVELDIQFRDQSADLTEESIRNIEIVGRALAEGRHAERPLAIRAHRGATSNGEEELALGWGRAEAVRSELIRRWGVDPGLFKAIAPGGEERVERADARQRTDGWLELVSFTDL